MSEYGVRALLHKPQGYVRLALGVILVVGCTGDKTQLDQFEQPFFDVEIIDVTITGGCVAAFTLLASGTKGDNPVAEILLGFTYMMLSFTSCSLYTKSYMLKKNFWDYTREFEYYFIVMALFGGAILWAVDLGLSIKENIFPNRGRPVPEPTTPPPPETAPSSTPEAEPKTKHKR